ncbi:TonB-dependent receptor [Pseudoroseomonas cervicalis]|uniref:TonB-dependent receptor n=1 Tax=Teichococcus cervicalis TaxID=204525 RepID=UPI002787FB9C|nr:TonB-dependent receptor [Pseudoroseomonas cervicalis]MDQ1080080.1 vitamin B12 transporter [Pseudoroseomonas cervicalis]
MSRPTPRPPRPALLPALLLAGLAAPLLPAPPARAQPAAGADPAAVALPDLVVTATGRAEPRSRLSGTVQVIDEATIANSTARSVTDLLAENAVGFFSEWTPGQTSLNLRGGATDGQGRDFRSQVLVLVNGRRAGTANLSKLSPADVARIEIVRGPASVIYGSQAMGGVINLILRDGRNSPGGFAELAGGTWGLARGHARYGVDLEGYSAYLGLSGTRRDDYRVGGGAREANTEYRRGGVTAAFGLPVGALGRVDITARSDGIYDAGFRGSAANTISEDDRVNESLDIALTGAREDGRLSWNLQAYAVRDVDTFRWASPVIRSGNSPAPGTALDWNKRRLEIIGTRLQPTLRLWAGNDLLLGFDAEQSTLRSDRFRLALPGGPAGQVAPYDNNETNHAYGLYAEDAQRLFDDRLTLRAGIRQSWGTTRFDPTPNLAGYRGREADFDSTTYSLGASFQALEHVTLRTGWATGFRAPTATELAADFTAVGGGRTFGNANLKPESNDQVEIGATFSAGAAQLDLALFQNAIRDRITTRARPGVPNTSDYVNNPGEIMLRGLEAQFSTDLANLLALAPGWRWRAFANGSWNFDMIDRAKTGTNSRNAERVYRYQASLGTVFGGRDWDLGATGILRGPMYYNTEENLLIPQAEPGREYVHRKAPFWVVNLRGNYRIRDNVTLFGAVNNLFDVNRSPIFIGTDAEPYRLDPRFSNGGLGTSMPGRELVAGLQVTF